jgi:acyl carrier protein
MIPSYFVPLEKIPLTPNKKIDWRALPSPEASAGKDSQAPKHETEKKLQEIWSDILNIDKSAIGIHTSFFELGGHSLNATILVAKIHKEFDMEIMLAEVFRNPTIKEMAGLINAIGCQHSRVTKNKEEREEIVL